MTIKLLTALPFGGYTIPAGATILLDPSAEGGLVASKMAIWSTGTVDWTTANGAAPTFNALGDREVEAVQALVSEDVTVARMFTWAALPAPADYIGTAFVTDIGLSGSLWRSNGSTWGIVGGSAVLALQNTDGTTLTGTTTETIQHVLTLPAGLLGLNGSLVIQGKLTTVNNANNKFIRLRLGAVGSGIGGSALQDSIITTLVSSPLGGRIENRNSAASQIGMSGSLQDTVTSAAWVTATVNTAVATDLTTTFQLANIADTMQLRSLRITLVRP